MKSALIILSALMFCFKAKGQSLYFSTNFVTYCSWNNETSKFDDDCSGKAESTLFKLNSEATMFLHTTEKMSSAYYVSKNSYDKEYDLWEYHVKSDVGNEYIFYIDLKNNQIRILGNISGQDGSPYLVTHTLKKTWKDSEEPKEEVPSTEGSFQREYNYIATFDKESNSWSDWKEGKNTFVFNINDNADFTLYKASGKVETFTSVSKIFSDKTTGDGKKYQLMKVLDSEGHEIDLQLFDFGDAKLIYPEGLMIQFTNSK